MEQTDILGRIADIEREIATLPPGTVSPKKVRGKEYYYHRYTVNGKRNEEYIDFDAVDALRSQIEKRKELETEIKKLKQMISSSRQNKMPRKKDTHKFKTNVRIGEYLHEWAIPAKDYKKRECFEQLRQYVFGGRLDKVFILYGLRRTGKTTMIRQIILEMTREQFAKAAFMQVGSKDSLSAVNSDIKYLEEQGYKYIFIDEVTMMEDFIEGAALFSDIYASSGMKIVLSGTDSLGFIFTEHDQLYDRCVMLHTTFIPYREFESVIGVKGIDEFIRYGGTMSIGGIHYNEESSFATTKSTDKYIDSAIAKNIQHSLEYYQDGGHFRKLAELYERDELTSAINRVVNDINHRFTRQVLTKTFKSGDLSLASKNLLHDREKPFDLKDNIDEQFVLDSIRKILEILEKDEQSVDVDDSYALEIKEYLLLLDMIVEIDLLHFPNINDRTKKVAISQPGLRYAQTEALIKSLLLDEKFQELSVMERERVMNRIMGTIKGRMMEDIVLLETQIAKPHMQVFQLQFAVGEFDMVVHNPRTLTCEIYEIKYSKEVVPEQYQHLVNQEKCDQTEHRFGTITGKYVIYRGERKEVDGIQYLNVEDYLKNCNGSVTESLTGILSNTITLEEAKEERLRKIEES